MTALQIQNLQLLLDGHIIVAIDPFTIRIVDKKKNPIANMPGDVFYWLKGLNLLRAKGHIHRLDRKAIRSLHGNNAIKRLYKGKEIKAGRRNTTPPIKRKDPPPQNNQTSLF